MEGSGSFSFNPLSIEEAIVRHGENKLVLKLATSFWAMVSKNNN